MCRFMKHSGKPEPGKVSALMGNLIIGAPSPRTRRSAQYPVVRRVRFWSVPGGLAALALVGACGGQGRRADEPSAQGPQTPAQAAKPSTQTEAAAKQPPAPTDELLPKAAVDPCDAAMLKRGLQVYSDEDQPPEDPTITDIGDLNGDNQSDLVVEYRSSLLDWSIRVFVRESAPKCFREVYRGPGGSVRKGDAIREGWAEITFGVAAYSTECGRGAMTLRAAYQEGRYRVSKGDSCISRNDDCTFSPRECQAVAAEVVCGDGGSEAGPACAVRCGDGDRAACSSACQRGSEKSCRKACELQDAGACKELCLLDQAACGSLCVSGNLLACATRCDQDLEGSACLFLCRKGDAKACSNTCITSHARCNALCIAGNEAACSAADPEVVERAERAAAERLQASAEAKLPGLFDKCEKNRAAVLLVKKRWIAAGRAGDQAGVKASEKQMTALEPTVAQTLSDLREAIRTATKDEGPEFVRNLREVERRCSLPRWAGF